MLLIHTEKSSPRITPFHNGDQEAATEFFTLVYEELRLLARQYMRQERVDHTLQPTALVNEVYLRLFGENRVEWQNSAHFFIVAARQMRRILVDHARRQRASRRDGYRLRLPLEEADEAPQPIDRDLVALDQALSDLERFSRRASQVVELRFFCGLTEHEAAALLGVSVTTVKRDWEFAKAWLLSELCER